MRKAALDGLYFSGVARLLRPLAGGVGAIVIMHRVRPARSTGFQPNLTLEVTPQFLEETIVWLKRNAYEFVSLDEARSRLVNRDFRSRFVAITLDDGYRDNLIWAKPIFDRHGVPYTIFVTTGFAEGNGNLWWLALESIVADNERVEVDDCVIPSGSVVEKLRAHTRLKSMMLREPTYDGRLAFVGRLSKRYRYDHRAATRAACMDWDEVREVAADPLATIGAHTLSHPVLTTISERAVRKELVQSRRILAEKLQREVRHFAYPYGSDQAVGEREFAIAAEAGYATAVTTRLGVLKAADGSRLVELPRVNFDGRYQRKRYCDVLLSGVAPAIWSTSQRLARAPRRLRIPGMA